MTEPLTALDRAHAAAEAAPDDEALRWQVYAALAQSELFVLLECEPDDGPIRPQVFDLDEGRFVLAFDAEERLTEFTGGPAGYAGLPGRALAAMLAPAGLGLALNLGAVSSRLLPPDALGWLIEALEAEPQPRSEAPVGHRALDEADRLAAALTPHLPTLAGLVTALHLTEAVYPDASRAPLLTLETPAPEAARPLARMLAEALRFANAGPAEVDIAVVPEGAVELAELRAHALTLTPPAPVSAPVAAPRAPGSDPDKPPILR